MADGLAPGLGPGLGLADCISLVWPDPDLDARQSPRRPATPSLQAQPISVTRRRWAWRGVAWQGVAGHDGVARGHAVRGGSSGAAVMTWGGGVVVAHCVELWSAPQQRAAGLFNFIIRHFWCRVFGSK